MSFTVERFDARAWPDEQLEGLFDGAFPSFISADPVAAVYIGRIREWFADMNVMLVDEHDRPAAVGWGVPIRWTGEVTDLPTGYTDTASGLSFPLSRKRAIAGRPGGSRAGLIPLETSPHSGGSARS